MEECGWIESEVLLSENKRRARYYRLTKRGEEELRMQCDNWRQFSGVAAAVLKRG
jgi:DNA-binding PadR family transcriptional regulator